MVLNVVRGVKGDEEHDENEKMLASHSDLLGDMGNFKAASIPHEPAQEFHTFPMSRTFSWIRIHASSLLGRSAPYSPDRPCPKYRISPPENGCTCLTEREHHE
jgi:hypothetical protein